VIDAGLPDDVVSDDVARRAPTAGELLEMPGAHLTRTHLRDLGWPRTGVDAIFKACPNVILPGYSRPLIRAADYLALVEASTYDDDRVYPSRGRP
jgi:hypothetical protein